jgi:hypothetical protein
MGIGTKNRMNKILKSYDSKLFVVEGYDGKLHVHREIDRFMKSNGGMVDLNAGDYNPQYLFSLTDTWKFEGKAVEWGAEPLLETIRSLDEWNCDNFEDMVRRRERRAEDKKRIRENELRAIAADCRRDFARATNDINTSTLEKVDRRRMRNGIS